ncbi:DUF423 domain-containing protein [Alteromonas gilva]|uniref:DUF423 domain-containing protein n=1 Tax=Alteromonas gilva TaxID=2987522 RepID=A0ABT5L3Y0_9ALTE|nr:DUF423 domain-containing protein [Alteromonas gilva]MDC8830572.1 DUF423 domain-containing protein [Alteromonas gilva]
MNIQLVIGALLALSGVMLGAFGAHGLKSMLDSAALNTFEIGVRYQLYHGLAILMLAGLTQYASLPWCIRAAYFFIIGSALFSGSLYLLVLTGHKWLGPVTPLGGLCLMLGWLCVLVALVKGKAPY